ncbi:PREDICTED: probable FBD-associated F-box protein At1g32375 [Erythranthe guttata]|uniref:probable FBD-associated F-box protein At1g32375 n=1 Tax=Erythranthe guttata TaxID=4155 RepID=UPI00064DA036|nr:PREDICTED: probable FBD-associated F-box protein At1g32375 [Erythranthe guttata]|eukprot:XP_012849457.1 PREDICTED: probable FBD-associated F-box protein At1g32375 [Erythranthe guttata]
MDRISELPEDILQRILYFLPQSAAVRTSVLSKSWRHIWCTRSNLSFSQLNSKVNEQEFLTVVDKTLRRYCDQRLCIDEILLCMFSCHELVSLLDKWIPLLATIGVKEFCLFILSKDRNLSEDDNRDSLDLRVVFKAESLKILGLQNCTLAKNEISDKILSSCPLLTTVCFHECQGLKTLKFDKKLHKYLTQFAFVKHTAHTVEECSIEIDAPALEIIDVYGSKIRFHGHNSNLKSLSLLNVEICSNSLAAEQSQILHIDAPNITSFEYLGVVIPSISFAPTSGRSNLELYMRDDDVDDAQSWLLRLSKLLHALRKSEIHLDIAQLSRNYVHIQEDIIINGGNNEPVVVEHLQFSIGNLYSFPSVLNGLFCICRPRNITPSWFSHESNSNKETELKKLGQFFRNIEKMRESGNQEIWRDLKDLTLEGFDESRQQWQVLQVTRLSESPLPDFDRFRVRLQWSDRIQDCDSTSRILES